MNISTLFYKFNTALAWNAYLYALYKVTSSMLILLLYYQLSSNLFNAWANINSIIFILLLWADLGFRKSIPRYAPEFLKNSSANKKFIQCVLSLQIILLFIAIPLYSWLVSPFAQHIGSHKLLCLSILILLFISEGILAAIRLVYHAYFKQKFFNLNLSFFLLAETLVNTILFLNTHNSASLVMGLFITKLSFTTLAIIFFSTSLSRITKSKAQDCINTKDLYKQFALHSSVMWLTTGMRSISERNFMVPLLTYTLGPELANTYKIANDGALILQRIILKTIGTADTALLSYVEAAPHDKKLTKVAFTTLTTKMAALSLPFLGLICLIISWSFLKDYNTLVFKIFFIISISYLIEAMLLPYERLLEVKRSYCIILGIYFFYLLLLIILIISMYNALIGMVSTITLLCCVRLVSMLMMVYAARSAFTVHFPFFSFFLFLKRIIYIGIPFIFLIVLLNSFFNFY